MDPQALAKACEAEYVRIESPETVDWAVQKVFHVARSQSKAVVLACARDIQKKKIEDDDEPYKPSTALLPKVVAAPSPEAVAQAADVITQANRVVIVVGRGAIWWSKAGDAVRSSCGENGA